MSLFSHPFASEYPTSFTPLFRLLDDFDNYSRDTQGTPGSSGGRHHHNKVRTFSPRFDVREVQDGYELHGELPGIEQKDVEIEFTDAQTLTVRGRTERSYTSGTPPSRQVEGQKSGGAITEGGEQQHQSHKATVEDENEAGKSETQVVTQNQNQQVQHQPQDQAKYWVSERSVGEFARSFSFPNRVDQENVKASMKNGILSIWVPKAKKHEARKIQITG
jgi:HSP20 family molecular chaperone IbpA